MKNMFFCLLPPSVPDCQSTKFYLSMSEDLDHVIILMLSLNLLLRFTTWMNTGFVEKLNLMRFFSG